MEKIEDFLKKFFSTMEGVNSAYFTSVAQGDYVEIIEWGSPPSLLEGQGDPRTVMYLSESYIDVKKAIPGTVDTGSYGYSNEFELLILLSVLIGKLTEVNTDHLIAIAMHVSVSVEDLVMKICERAGRKITKKDEDSYYLEEVGDFRILEDKIVMSVNESLTYSVTRQNGDLLATLLVFSRAFWEMNIPEGVSILSDEIMSSSEVEGDTEIATEEEVLPEETDTSEEDTSEPSFNDGEDIDVGDMPEEVDLG